MGYFSLEYHIYSAKSSNGSSLTVRITGVIEGDDIVICVEDDGVGMSEDAITNMMNKESTTGLGIAVKNVQDRMYGYFGPDSRMEVKSEVDKGTSVSFRLDKAAVEGAVEDNTALQESAIPDIPQPVKG